MQEDCVNWEWSIVGRQARPVRRNSSSLHGWSELMTERLLRDEDGASSSSRSSEGGGTMKSTCRTNGRTDGRLRLTNLCNLHLHCSQLLRCRHYTRRRRSDLRSSLIIDLFVDRRNVPMFQYCFSMLTSRAQRITAYYYSVLPPTRRSTLGDRAFPAAAARAWNDLPPTIRASPSLLTFRRQLTTLLSS